MPNAKTTTKPEAETKPVRDIAAERKAASALLAAFEAERQSVPVKTTAAFKPIAVSAHPIARKPSVRQAAAIAVAFAASGTKLSDGAKASRQFKTADGAFCIENGALRDAISSGLITVSGDAGSETLTIAKAGTKAIIGLIGEAKAKRAKIA